MVISGHGRVADCQMVTFSFFCSLFYLENRLFIYSIILGLKIKNPRSRVGSYILSAVWGCGAGGCIHVFC